MSKHTTHEPAQEIPYGYCHCGCGQKTKIAKMTSTANGIFRGQPYRFIAGHYARTRPTRSAEARFWEKVDKRDPDECWEWQAAKDTHGYGRFYDGNRLAGAHQFVYILIHGSIGEGLEICHRCDNPACCNPAHLFEGSRLDNIRDMDAKGRGRRSGFHGETHPRTHLTDDNVREIRQLAADGLTRRLIGARFGIHGATVGDIVKRRSWKHVE